MEYRNYLMVLLTILVFVQCTKELPFPDAEDDAKMVINSLFSPENGMAVHVSRSCHIQDAGCSNAAIVGAEVLLLDNTGALLTTLDYQEDGVYAAPDYKLSHNTEYHVEVKSNDQSLADVASKSITPQEVNSTLLRAEEAEVNGRLAWVFDVEINDNPTEENYYLLEGSFMLSKGEHQDWETEYNGYTEPHFKHYTDDPNAENKVISAVALEVETPPLKYVFLTDKNFNGEKYEIRFGVIDYDLYDFGNQEVTANLAVKSVSKEMYEYTKSLASYALRSGNPFSEPEQIYTNIDEGIGIFAGYTEETFTIELPESEYYFPREVMVGNDGCTGPCTMRFSTDGGVKLNYAWDFGDGQTFTDPVVEYSFESPGLYGVKCIVDDGAGRSSYWGFQVTVN